nr:receptor-like protein EIX2 [Coffea arabica]XP_027098762.1 receptor-like protein EIX2 [Coffea arabica]
MEHHLLCTPSSLLLLFLFSSIPITSQFTFGSSKQAYHHSNATCIESERRALLQLKHGLKDESNRLSSWIGEGCCSWEGVGCHKTTGSVLKLDLRNTVPLYSDENSHCTNCLGGQLSPFLVNLTNLRYLDLSVNNFSTFQVPTFLGLLENLRYLNLSNAKFDGEIPHHLGNLSHLRYLDIGLSSSGSTIKDLKWVVRLSSLEVLVLSLVNLSAAQDGLRAISMLPSLTTLNLFGCHLFIHPHLSPANFTSLSSLDLGENNFSNHMIPPWLGNLTGLLDLRLGDNNFSNPIHGLFEQMTSLLRLDLWGNRFDVSFFKSLCNLSNLTYLDLSSNDLQLSIPSEIGQLSRLAALSLFGFNLYGSIPVSLGQLTKLQVLDISYTSLTGVLSEDHLGKLGELKSLFLSHSFLTLNLSSTWVPPFQLQQLEMASIKVGPQFPGWLWTQKFEELDMSNAGISDAIPSWFRVLCYDISSLDLSNNNLTGNPLEFKELKNNNYRFVSLSSNKLEGSLKSFPSDISSLDLSQNFLTGEIPPPYVGQMDASTYFLKLSGNRFTGSIPEDLCKLKSLSELDLSNNLLSGKVPLCFGGLRFLWVLNLANNNLCGQIPSSLGNLGALEILHLNGNKFIGRLPSSMQHLSNLVIFDLGDNGLRDTIPAWIGEMSSNLMFLRFQSNNFYGGISDKLCLLSNLQVLNLAHNNLTGYIPHCFNNFSMMVSSEHGSILTITYDTTNLQNYKGGNELEYSFGNLVLIKSISLSTNNLVGEIPDGIMDLAGLQTLNLSHNHLTGRISEKIGNLKRLETLDLSMNEFFGAIPDNLATINSLSFLNLSHNSLSGEIPSGNQLQTLTDPSIYEGNSGLCGKPLPKNCPENKSPAENDPILDDKDHGEFDWSWFYAGIGPGFALGIVGFLAILLFKRSWRYAYFEFLESASDRIAAMIALKTTRRARNFH